MSRAATHEPIIDRVPGQPRLAFHRAGAGPPVVFLHGVGADRRMWDEQLRALANGFLTVAWDARGYGASDDYDGPFVFADVCADIERLLNQLGVERAHIVGQSMGGLIAQDFYARAPDRVRSLTLVDTTQSLRRSMTSEQIEAFLAARREPLSRGVTPADLAPALAQRLVAPQAAKEVRARVIEILSGLRAHSYIKALEAVTRHEGLLRLETVSVPTLVIVGELDEITPPAASQNLAEKIVGAALRILPNAGHMANMEQPAAFNDALRSFLEQN
jgi:3-oxoadipate enol-lactonase